MPAGGFISESKHEILSGLSAFADFVADADNSGQQDLGIAVGALERGLYLPEDGLAVVPEAALLGRRVLQSRRRRGQGQDNPDAAIRSLMELSPGVPVVHADHGVGLTSA